MTVRRALTPITQMYLAMFLIAVSHSAASTILPPYAKELGYEVAAVGMLVAVFSVLSLASRLPAGALGAHARVRWLAGGTAVLFALSMAAQGVTTELGPLVVIRAINGFAYGVVTTINMALLMEAIERPEQRGSVTGWYLGVIAAGHAVGGYASGFLTDAVGFALSFVVWGLGALVAVPFAVARGSGRAATPVAAGHSGAPLGTSLRALLRDRALLVPTLQAFTINALSHVMWTFYPLYGLSVGLSLAALGVQRGTYSACSMLTRPFTGHMGKWVNYSTLAHGGLVLTVALTLIVPWFTGFWPLLVLSGLLGGVRSSTLVGSMAATMEHAGSDARRRGQAAGLYTFGTDAANMLAPFVGGLIGERTGVPALFWVMPLGLLGLYGALYALARLGSRSAAITAVAGDAAADAGAPPRAAALGAGGLPPRRGLESEHKAR